MVGVDIDRRVATALRGLVQRRVHAADLGDHGWRQHVTGGTETFQACLMQDSRPICESQRMIEVMQGGDDTDGSFNGQFAQKIHGLKLMAKVQRTGGFVQQPDVWQHTAASMRPLSIPLRRRASRAQCCDPLTGLCRQRLHRRLALAGRSACDGGAAPIEKMGVDGV